MAETAKLKRFHIEPAADGFTLSIESDDGHDLALSATRDQVDLIADTLDELLSQSDEDDVVDDKQD